MFPASGWGSAVSVLIGQDSALEAADEIGLAVTAISLTIVAVFVPSSFMQSIPGQFFKQFGLTVSIQVLFSLLCARLITPLLAANFLQPHPQKDRADGPVMRRYGRLVTWAVRHRFITIVVGFSMFAVAMVGASALPTGFLPPPDTSRSTLCIELPPGSELTDTQQLTDAITQHLLSRPEVESVFVDGGRIPPEHTEERIAALTISYVPRAKRSLSQQELQQSISRSLADIPDFRMWFLQDNGQRSVSFIIAGRDAASVANVADALTVRMRPLWMVNNVVSTATLNRPELRIRPRRDLAVRLGISIESLSETIRVATIGDVAPALASYNDEASGRVVPIRVLLEEQARADPHVLVQLRVPSATGAGVPLISVADFSLEAGPINISRYDRQREARVEADLINGATLSQALDAVKTFPILKELPSDVTVSPGGDAELQDELFEGFNTAMWEGLTMAYVVLALLFGSLLHPLTIMFSLPLSVSGTIMALYLAGGLAITTPVLIGILMSMGIVTKNAIMLVDFAVESIRKGTDRTAGIIDAAHKRARPIMMTSIAMAAGMAPSALGIGLGGEFRSPVAISVIGGILVSTFLSLLFVPAFFTVIDDLGLWLVRLAGGLVRDAHKLPRSTPPQTSSTVPLTRR